MIARGGGSSAGGALRIAVPKGALFAGGVAMLAGAGLEVGRLADPGRQLIIRTPETEFIIAKPSDVPVYVAYGAADCGIAGRDVLMEAALEVVELADLGFGGCRFVVAGRAGDGELDERYRHLGVLRVATKYPRIAAAHFEERGIQVELVKLYGNIELAPLIGIADVVVDITATGTTLAENGLRVIEEVLPSTARFVANPVALRVDPRVEALAEAMSQRAGTVGQSVQSADAAASARGESDASVAPESSAEEGETT